jgi:DNA-directed RNA polymerase subunit K/omega
MEYSSRMFTPFEVARLLGMRSLALSSGSVPSVVVKDDRLRIDTLYVAALEIHGKHIKIGVNRPDGTFLSISDTTMHPCLLGILDSKDGGQRSYKVSTLLS